MQYPIFVTVTEAAQLLSCGKTTIYAMISEKKLRVAKFNRSTRITFSSVIECALEGLAAGSGHGQLSEILMNGDSITASRVADFFASQLCYILQGNAEVESEGDSFPESSTSEDTELEFSEKNSGGEF
ncbi:helix-turn-helix domain-containing protein [Erythrobacter arachoides]|uniref:Helix-turn-helix domain-containing protein n=1 Tax=Aurantiacibacter arachoides TaxID=1850444 RepID=A0A844ZXG8_9SPHN|nr:helix-turn-helix domain-containing protein [Aurantiacibacter arachoides]MXO92154.1 helix-turn-helix domain-containing protein [Aurantiacibacter arachoides]